MPAVVAVVDAISGDQGLPRRHIEGDLTRGIHRNRRARLQHELQLIAAVLLDPVGRRRGGWIAGDRRHRLGERIEREVDLGLAVGLLEIPEVLEHRIQIGVGIRLRRLDNAAVHLGGAGGDRDAVEGGAGHRLSAQRLIGAEASGELELGGGRGGDLIGGRAIETAQIAAAEAIGSQEAVDPFDRVADQEIVEQQRVAVEIAAATAIHRCGVGAIGHQRPAPAIEIAGTVAIEAGFEAQIEGVLPAELLHAEAGAEQPALRQLHRPIRQGSACGLAQGHQTGAGRVGVWIQLGPELDRVGAGGATGAGGQAIAAAGGLGPLADDHLGVAAVEIEGQHLRDRGAAGQAETQHLVAHLQRVAQIGDGEGGVAVGAAGAAEAARKAHQRQAAGFWQGPQRGGGQHCAAVGAGGVGEGVDAALIGVGGAGQGGDRGAGRNALTHQQLAHSQAALADAGDREAGAIDGAVEDCHRAVGRNDRRLRGVAQDIKGGAVVAAQAGGQHPQALHVLHGAGAGFGQGSGDQGVEAGAGDEGFGVAGGGAEVEAVDAGLQAGHRHVQQRRAVEHRLVVGGAHRLAPAEHWRGQGLAGLGRGAAGRQGQQGGTAAGAGGAAIDLEAARTGGGVDADHAGDEGARLDAHAEELITHLQGAGAGAERQRGVTAAAEAAGEGDGVAGGIASEGHGRQVGAAAHRLAGAHLIAAGTAGGGGPGDGGDGGAGFDAGAEDQITHRQRTGAERADGEGGAVDDAAEAGHRLHLHLQGGGAEIGDREAGAAILAPGDRGDRGLATGVVEQRIPGVTTEGGGGVGIDQPHLDHRQLAGDQLLGIGLGIFEGADRQFGPHQQRALHTIDLHHKAAQIGDQRVGGGIEILDIHIVPLRISAGLAGGGIAVVDALVAIKRIHERLVVGLAITAGQGDDGIGGFHPEHIGGVGGGIGDRRGIVGGGEVGVAGCVVDRLQRQLTGRHRLPAGAAAAGVVEVDNRVAIDIGHPVLHREAAVAGKQRQLIGHPGGEKDAGVMDAGVGAEAVLIGEVVERLLLGSNDQRRVDQIGIAKGLLHIHHQGVGKPGIGGRGQGEVERLIKGDGHDRAGTELHRGGDTGIERRDRVAGAVVAEQLDRHLAVAVDAVIVGSRGAAIGLGIGAALIEGADRQLRLDSLDVGAAQGRVVAAGGRLQGEQRQAVEHRTGR